MHDAAELFRARQYPAVVATCSDAIADDPIDVPLRVLLARALMALRRDGDAQRELRACLQIDPRCPQAYRLLGELALRRDELESARMFLKEALRIDGADRDAEDLLGIVESLNQPTAAVEKLPAATAAVGCTSSPKPRRAPTRPPRLAKGSDGAPDDEGRRNGFGKYLVRVGILTSTQLSAVLGYQHRNGGRIGDAAVALGFISEPKIEWAALAYHSRRR